MAALLNKKPGPSGPGFCFMSGNINRRWGDRESGGHWVRGQRGSPVPIDQGMRLAGQGPAGVQQGAPELAAFPEAIVAGAIAKAEEEGQRYPKEGKGAGLRAKDRIFSGCRIISAVIVHYKSQWL